MFEILMGVYNLAYRTLVVINQCCSFGLSFCSVGLAVLCVVQIRYRNAVVFRVLEGKNLKMGIKTPIKSKCNKYLQTPLGRFISGNRFKQVQRAEEITSCGSDDIIIIIKHYDVTPALSPECCGCGRRACGPARSRRVFPSPSAVVQCSVHSSSVRYASHCNGFGNYLLIQLLFIYLFILIFKNVDYRQ